MASAQVDDSHLEEFNKLPEETTLGSPTIEGSAKAPIPQNIQSPYEDEDDEEDVILPDELEKQDSEEGEKALSPQIIEDEDDDDDDDEHEDEDDKALDEPMSKSAAKATEFSEEDVDEEDD